jgi:hypothetical protein
MISAVIHLSVDGDSYEEVLEKTYSILSEILDLDSDQVQNLVDIEIEIFENEELMENDSALIATITARLKNVR